MLLLGPKPGTVARVEKRVRLICSLVGADLVDADGVAPA
jgi:hypothetical protein